MLNIITADTASKLSNEFNNSSIGEVVNIINEKLTMCASKGHYKCEFNTLLDFGEKGISKDIYDTIKRDLESKGYKVQLSELSYKTDYIVIEWGK